MDAKGSGLGPQCKSGAGAYWKIGNVDQGCSSRGKLYFINILDKNIDLFRETAMPTRGYVRFKANLLGMIFANVTVVMVMFELIPGRLRLQTYRKDRPIG